MRKKTKNPMLKERCPVCKKYDDVGDQGYGKFFCCVCCIEFRKSVTKFNHPRVEIYTINEDGKQSLSDDYVNVDGFEYDTDEYNTVMKTSVMHNI